MTHKPKSHKERGFYVGHSLEDWRAAVEEPWVRCLRQSRPAGSPAPPMDGRKLLQVEVMLQQMQQVVVQLSGPV